MLRRLIRTALEEPNEDLRRFASYQHVIWSRDADCYSTLRCYCCVLIFVTWFQSPLISSLRRRLNGLKPCGTSNQKRWYVAIIGVHFKGPTYFQDVSGPLFILRPTHLLDALEKRYELALCMLACLTLFTVKLKGSRWRRSSSTWDYSSVILV